MSAVRGATLYDCMVRPLREGDLVIDTRTGGVGYVAIDLADLEDPWVFVDHGPDFTDLACCRPNELRRVSPLEALASAGA